MCTIWFLFAFCVCWMVMRSSSCWCRMLYGLTFTFISCSIFSLLLIGMMNFVDLRFTTWP